MKSNTVKDNLLVCKSGILLRKYKNTQGAGTQIGNFILLVQLQCFSPSSFQENLVF